jgi:hypothetical protein
MDPEDDMVQSDAKMISMICAIVNMSDEVAPEIVMLCELSKLGRCGDIFDPEGAYAGRPLKCSQLIISPFRFNSTVLPIILAVIL